MKKISGGALPRSYRVPALIAAMIGASALAGCVVDHPVAPARPAASVVVTPPPTTHVIVARPAPPAPRVEVQPAAPDTRAVWDPGHWNWDGNQYVWISGRYIERPNVAMRWEPGRWMSENGSWVWMDGRWY
jgi:hypothetical protein